MKLIPSNSPPTRTCADHQWTVSINTSCNQWLSLAKPTLKMAPAGRNCSLMTCTSKCGWAVNYVTRFSTPFVLAFGVLCVTMLLSGAHFQRIYGRGINITERNEKGKKSRKESVSLTESEHRLRRFAALLSATYFGDGSSAPGLRYSNFHLICLVTRQILLRTRGSVSQLWTIARKLTINNLHRHLVATHLQLRGLKRIQLKRSQIQVLIPAAGDNFRFRCNQTSTAWSVPGVRFVFAVSRRLGV